jgi:hypothetical protein
MILSQRRLLYFLPPMLLGIAQIWTSIFVITETDNTSLHLLERPHVRMGYQNRTYFRLDEAGPRIFAGKVHYFQSLPTTHRLPSHLDASRLKDYLSSQNDRQDRLYWEYNPSLAELPNNQIPSILNSDRRYYLGVYRLSNQQGCFKKMGLPKELKNFGTEGPINLLGFAILDTSLEMKAEAIFVFEGRDFRVFSLQQQLYLTKDKKLWPIWLIPPSNITVHKENAMNLIVPLTPFGSNGSFGVYKRQKASCCTSQYCTGKNFNYFVSKDDRIMVDSRPMSPHIVEFVNVEEPCGGQTFQPVITEANYTPGVVHLGNSPFVTNTLPDQSFDTVDQDYFPKYGISELPYTEERGTACCVAIPNPFSRNSELFVGVSHTKLVRWRKDTLESYNINFTSRQYNSRLYAFEPEPPFRIVARSGQFCMPFPTKEEENPHSWLIRNAPLVIGTNMSCPFITFVMGMTDDIADPSRVIISYGMNDCGARVVKVAKIELIQMLFTEDHNEEE